MNDPTSQVVDLYIVIPFYVKNDPIPNTRYGFLDANEHFS